MDYFTNGKTIQEGTLQWLPEKLPWTQTGESLNIPVINVADQSYGKVNDTLDASLALRNLPSSTITTKIGTFQTIVATTGSLSITGIWFTPSMVRVYTGVNSTSDSSATSSSSVFGTSFDHIFVAWYNHTNILNIRDSGVAVIIANFISMDTDGFTINVTTNTTATKTHNFIAYK